MKNDANIRNFIEYLGNLHGKSWKICGKSFHFFPQPLSDDPFFAVVFGRFRSFFRKMENIGEIFPFSFLFFPLYYTFIPHFQISQILCSTTCLL